MIASKSHEFLSTPQAAQLMGVSYTTVIDWIKNGVYGVKLAASRVGGRWRIAHEDLAEFNAAMNSETPQQTREHTKISAKEFARKEKAHQRAKNELVALGIL